MGRQRGPVVHLCVDVDGVIAIPRRLRTGIPEPLQIGSLRSGTRCCNGEVAPKMKIQRVQGRISFAFLQSEQSFTGRKRTFLAAAQIEFCAAIEGLIILNMRIHQLGKGFLDGRIQFPTARLNKRDTFQNRMTVPAGKTGADIEKQHHFISLFHVNNAAFRCDFSAICFQTHFGIIAHAFFFICAAVHHFSTGIFLWKMIMPAVNRAISPDGYGVSQQFCLCI